LEIASDKSGLDDFGATLATLFVLLYVTARLKKGSLLKIRLL
tara:strand:- start:223 stop:348 length:126 start_codon:yes stop_codon:yes gene_type:complete